MYAESSKLTADMIQFKTAITLNYALYILPSIIGIGIVAVHLIKLKRDRRSSQQSAGHNLTSIHYDPQRDSMPDRVLRPEEYTSAQLSLITSYS